MKRIAKAICLLLVLGLVAGMFGLSASASGVAGYSDSERIENAAAVSLLTDLGIVKGTDRGVFDPDAPVTRAAMAKMICVILSGGDNAAAYISAAPSFSDVRGHWAEGYIEFCAVLGIAAGDGTGRFRPDEPVTGTQAAKMLLAALGNDPAREGLTGARWQLYTLIAAYSAGLFNGIDRIPSSVYTRDEAAQMLYNALINAKTVYYGDTGRLETGKTLGQARFGLALVSGTVAENEYGSVAEPDAAAAEGTTLLAADAGGRIRLSVSTGPEYLGRKVSVYTKNGDGDSLYGEPQLAAENTEWTATSALSGTELKALLSSKGLTLYGGTPLVVNCGGHGIYEVTDADAFSNSAGEETAFVDNDGDGVVDYVLRMHRYVGTVTGYSASRGVISVASLGTWGPSLTEAEAWRVAGFDTVKKGDIVLYHTVGRRVYVEPCAITEGTAQYRRGQAVSVGGAEYEQSGLVSYVKGTMTLAEAVTLNAQWILYLDRAGYAVAAEPAAPAALTEQYLVVLDSNAEETITVFNPLRARLLLSDGTLHIAEISGIGGAPAGEGNKTLAERTAVYRYAQDGSGSYSLTLLTSGEGAIFAGIVTELRAGRAVLAGGETPVYAGSQTVFFVYSEGRARVYRGCAGAPDLTGAVVCGMKNEYGVAQVLFVSGGVPAELAGEALFILDANPLVTLDEDGRVVYRYIAAVNGEAAEIPASGAWFPDFGLYASPVWAGGRVVSAGEQISPRSAVVAGYGIVGTSERAWLCGAETRIFAVDPESGTPEEIRLEDIRTEGDGGDKLWIVSDPEDEDAALFIYVLREENPNQ